MKNKTIYIDTPRNYGHKSGLKFSHMTCQDVQRLHEFAKKLGIKKCWFENKKNQNRPHYDVKEEYFEAAKKLGAIHLVGYSNWSNKMNDLFGSMYKLKNKKLF